MPEIFDENSCRVTPQTEDSIGRLEELRVLGENLKERINNGVYQRVRSVDDSVSKSEEQKNVDENLKGKKNNPGHRRPNRVVRSRYKLGISGASKRQAESTNDVVKTSLGTIDIKQAQPFNGRCSLSRTSSLDVETASKLRHHDVAKNLDFPNNVLVNMEIPNCNSTSEIENRFTNVYNSEKAWSQEKPLVTRSSSMKVMVSERPLENPVKTSVEETQNRNSEIIVSEKTSNDIPRTEFATRKDIFSAEFPVKEEMDIHSSGNEIAVQADQISYGSDTEFLENRRMSFDTLSDTESVSSVATSTVQESTGASMLRESTGCVSQASAKGRSRRGTVVPARFLQETMKRVHKPSNTQHLPETAQSSKSLKGFLSNKSVSIDGLSKSSDYLNLICRPRACPSKNPNPNSKISSSASSLRSLSPINTREQQEQAQSASQQNVPCSSAGYACNFKADALKGKQPMSHVEALHHLRILNNRLLQWQFINAKAKAVNNARIVVAEKALYNAEYTLSELQESVQSKTMKLQRAKQAIILKSVLSKQMSMLNTFELFDKDYSETLSEATKYLQAATMRLPVIDGARLDIMSLKEALDSADEVLQALDSPLDELLQQAEETSSLSSALADVATQARSVLDECNDMLSRQYLLKIEESSLRAQLIQLNQETAQSLSRITESAASNTSV